jgi:preprotein translocase subunit SecA
LQAIDKLWQEHLYEMDSLRHSIGLRAHGQRDPLLEYKAEAFKIFDELMVNVKTEICHNVFRSASSPCWRLKISCATHRSRRCTTSTVRVRRHEHCRPEKSQRCRQRSGSMPRKPRPKPNLFAPARKVGRNDPCPAAAARNTSNCCGK